VSVCCEFVFRTSVFSLALALALFDDMEGVHFMCTGARGKRERERENDTHILESDN